MMDREAQRFAKIHARLSKYNIAGYAVMVRRGLHPHHAIRQLREPTVSKPTYGMHHMVFKILFEDGLAWALKFPIQGEPDRWTDLLSRSLRSEALTMKLLARTTKIPIPKVIDFDTDLDSVFECPYILMEWVSGQSLYDVWEFGLYITRPVPDEVEARRARALRDIAAAMKQLGKFRFSSSGMLQFDGGGEVIGLEAHKIVDRSVMKNLLPSDIPSFDAMPSRYSTKDFLRWPLVNQEGVNFFNKRRVDRDDNIPIGHKVLTKGERACLALTKHFIDALTDLIGNVDENYENFSHQFVLAYPDFKPENFIVSQDGSLLAIVDWDGVCSVPRVCGNESYPDWIADDWLSGRMAIYHGKGKGAVGMGREDTAVLGRAYPDSCANFRRYRSIYLEAMVGGVVPPWPSLTASSLIPTMLLNITREPSITDMSDMLFILVAEINQKLSPEDELNFDYLVEHILLESIGEDRLRLLYSAFVDLAWYDNR